MSTFGSKLWWKGDQTWATIGQANELQLLVNQARVTTGCFRTTNQASGSPAGEQTATVRITVAQPASGRPG